MIRVPPYPKRRIDFFAGIRNIVGMYIFLGMAIFCVWVFWAEFAP